MSNVKRIDIKEFREQGFLQEANRLFFHPLGLALEVVVDKETGKETLGGVWDYREDPEGITYDIKNLEEPERLTMLAKAENVASEYDKHIEARCKLFGSEIEPVNF